MQRNGIQARQRAEKPSLPKKKFATDWNFVKSINITAMKCESRYYGVTRQIYNYLRDAPPLGTVFVRNISHRRQNMLVLDDLGQFFC